MTHDLSQPTMVTSDKTAREIFEEIRANPARARFGFGEKLAIVNVEVDPVEHLCPVVGFHEVAEDQVGHAQSFRRSSNAAARAVSAAAKRSRRARVCRARSTSSAA